MSQDNPFGLSEESLLFGRIAVEHNLITRDQLTEALVAQTQTPDKAIGQILAEQGVLSTARVDWVLQQQAAEAAMDAAQEAPATVLTATTTSAGQQEQSLTSTAEIPALTVPVATPVAVAEPMVTSAAQPAVHSIPLTSPSPPSAPLPTPSLPGSAMPTTATPSATITTSQPASGGGVAAALHESPPCPELDEVVRMAASHRASDLHLHAGSSYKVRIDGVLRPVEGTQANSEMNERILQQILPSDLLDVLEAEGQIDFSHTVTGTSRLRCNAYRQQNGTDIVFRLVSPTPPTLADLGLPESLARFANYHQGLVLITGPTGCGKSSTLAALLGLVNEAKPDHILTVEDPIEYIHASKKCVVNQRQISRHTEDFSRALRAALREDPDVIVIGELRDLETISLALTAAETGHLVLGTMHTMNAIATINRVIGAFPPDEQAQIRTMVSESLRAIVSQRLVKRADGQGRVPALEILVANQAIANLIREQKTFQIPGMMQSGVRHGMCQLDQSLVRLVKEGQITKQEALIHCDNPKSLG